MPSLLYVVNATGRTCRVGCVTAARHTRRVATFLLAGHGLRLFASVRDALAHVEAIDVDEGEYRVEDLLGWVDGQLHREWEHRWPRRPRWSSVRLPGAPAPLATPDRTWGARDGAGPAR